MYNAVTTNTRDFRNNLLINARSNSGTATGKHYAIWSAGAAGLTCNFNDYYVTGTGGVLGYIGGDKATLSAWQTATGQDGYSLNVSPSFANAGGSAATDYIPSYNRLCGITGTGITTDYTTAARIYNSMGAYDVYTILPVEAWKSGVLQATYLTLYDAFTAINAGTHTGDLEIRITGSTNEYASAALNASGSGSASYTSINIYPTVSGLSISGNLSAPLIQLNGADNVTIDGRVNATGTPSSTSDMLTIVNPSATTASTIQFINGACSNTVQYCNVKGAAPTSYGIVMFSTSAASYGATTGNYIQYNNITNSGTRPINAIYSAGTASYGNNTNYIQNNNIYDFLSASTASYGIYLYSNSSGWTISGNSFYETTSFAPSANVLYNIIYIQGGNGHTINYNYIGGQEAKCGGLPWTKTNTANNNFYNICLNVSTGAVTSVQGNIIQNFNWNNSGAGQWHVFRLLTGDLNVTGNTIGSGSSIGSINFASAATGSVLYGMFINSSGTVTCSNNTIGSITCTNAAANAANIYGFYKTGVAGALTISNNTIGSTTEANSIYASSGSTSSVQTVYGIYNLGTGTNTFSGNTIANLTNGTTNGTPGTAGLINGIYSSAGTNTVVSGNTIRDLTIFNANTATDYTCSVGGIVFSGTGTVNTATGNTIYNLKNKYATFAGQIAGIYFTGSTGANVCNRNFIYGLSVDGASSTTASIYGIKAVSGATTYSNNIISLGGNTPTTLYGIYDTGAASQTCSLYFNTVYIGGTPTSGSSNKSYCLYSAASNNTRNYLNNILYNARSTASPPGSLHYAAYFTYSSATNLALDYNDYLATGASGAMLGYAAGDKSGLPIIATRDTHSLNVDPLFSNKGGTAAVDYVPQVSGINGTGSTGIATDYFGVTTRSNYTMGAIEQMLATVTTEAVSGIGATTATGNGTITSLGTPNPTAHGVCWSSTNANPTTSDSKVDNGAATATVAFTAAMTGLTPGTLYYVRAYATNGGGTSYGNVVTFTTYIAPTVTTQAVSAITTTTATGNGNITSLGTPASVTSYGVCWSNTNATPTTSDQMVDKGAAPATGAFTAAITGLTPGTTYYVRAFATNGGGTSYGAVVTFTSYIAPTVTTQAVSGIGATTATGNGNITSLGVPNPTAYGVCWSNTNATPTTSDSKVDNGAATVTGAFTAGMTGLTPGTTYYVRAYATNAAGTSYGAVVTFTSYIAPTVTTQAVSGIGATTATGNGNITSLGLPNPTAYGVCWSNTNTTPTISDSKVDNGAATVTGAFTAAMTGLSTSTVYYVRAYATNAVGTVYGAVVTFDNFNYWYGTTNTDWNTTSNWSLNILPASGDDLYFAAIPSNHCVMDQNRTIGSLHNAQSTYRTVTNGHNLTINGAFNQSNGAQVDASATGSTVTFAGSSAQSIPAGTFYNNQVVNVAVNNANNVTLYGSLNLSGSITSTAGALDATSQSPSVTLNGSTAQTLESNTWLNNSIYNLTIANTAGVNDNALFTVSNNLTINTDRVLTINAAKTLNVNGTLTNNAGNSGLILASTATGTGSLVHNTNSVPATVNRYIDGAASAWHFLSSPVSGQAIHGTGWTPSGTYGDGTGYDLYVWDEPASCWIYNLNTTVDPTWSTVHPTAGFVPGRGYLYAVQAATPTKQFAGNLNNGTVNYALNCLAIGSYKGFNLIGNPYPSSIDWKIDGGYSRSQLEQSGGGYNVWIWSTTADNYGVYNSAFAGDAGTNNVTRYIPPMEGFFVQAASTGTFSFYNSCRVHNEASNWLKAKSVDVNDNLMKIRVSSDAVKGQDEVMLYFGCPDNENGAMKIFNTTYESGINKSKAPNLFLPYDKKNYSIRYIGDTKENTNIPLNIKVLNNAGYVLHFSVPDTMQNAVLEDKLTGQFNRIVNGGSYSFKASTTDQVSRFNIRFGSVEGNEILPILIYRSGDDLIIDALAMKGDFQIRMLDLTGRNYFTKYEHGGTKNIIPVKIRQVYLITVTTQEQRSEYKIIF